MTGRGATERREEPPVGRPADAADGRVPVVYIAGIGRSGTTLLNRVLGRVDGWFAGGEVMHFFGRGLAAGELCACGRSVPRCRVWGRVGRRVRREADLDDPGAVDELRHRLTEGAAVGVPFLPWRPGGLEGRLEGYRDLLGHLYRAILRVTGSRVVVDSSKNASYARILAEVPGIRLRILHLVRDSRGVAHSLGQLTRRPGARGDGDHLDRRGPAVGSVLWSAANVLAEASRARADGYVRLRYRDFVRTPAPALERLFSSWNGVPARLDAGGPPATIPGLRDDSVELGVQHLLAGNPMRSRTGRIRLEEDLRWRRSMPRLSRGLVTALTLPLLVRYGFLPDGRRPERDPSDGERRR